MTDYTLPLDQLPDPLPIEPLTKPFDVTITPPGSKSITCRAYVLAALAEGESKIIRPLRADDTEHLLNALCTLGAEARWDGEDVYIRGVGGRFPRGGHLYMGEGGTPTRFMIACACLAKEPVVIDASPRMRERPITEGVDMLRQLGAKIEYVEAEGRLPVRVVPSVNFYGGQLTVGKTSSSQFISACMLIAPVLPNGLLLRFAEMVTSSSYARLTNFALMDWGIETTNTLSIPSEHGELAAYVQIGHQGLHSASFFVEADASSACYFAAASTMLSGSRVMIRNISSDTCQPDTAMFDALDDLGMIVSASCDGWHIEGTVGLQADEIDHDTFDFSLQPDASLAFASCIAVQGCPISLTGLRTLRVKETDRIAALANELRKVGCTVETGEDWISITPPSGALRPNPRAEPGAKGFEHAPVVIETYNDHRMAMAFAVLGLNPPNGVPLAIRNPKCVAKSYPGFWKDFAKLYKGSRQ